MDRLLRVSLAALAIGLASFGCGPPRGSVDPPPAKLADTSEEARTKANLVGKWSVEFEGKDQGVLEIRDGRRFVLKQSDPSDPSIQVTLQGAYYVDGSQVIRFVDKADVTGGASARRSEIQARATDILEKPQLATIEWNGEDGFRLVNPDGGFSTYTRVAPSAKGGTP